MSIFISHASKDYEPFVGQIVNGLREKGLAVHALNRNSSIDSDQAAFDAVNESLSKANVAVIIASPSYFQNSWCKAEIGAIWSYSVKGLTKMVVVRHNMSESEFDVAAPLFAGRWVIDGSNPESLIVDWIAKAESHRSLRNRNQSPIKVICSGFGKWARNRTILPLLEQSPDLFETVAVSDLENDEREYKTVVLPELRRVLGDRKAEQIGFYSHLPAALQYYEKYLHQEQLAVLINTPNRFHDSLSTTALHLGFDVYAERPINRSGEKLSLLLRRASEKNLYLYTGTQRRAEDSFSYLRYAVTANEQFDTLSSIRCILGSGRRLEGWRTSFSMAGGGIIMDEGYHLLDAALWLATAADTKLAALTKDDIVGYASATDFVADRIEATASGQVRLGNINLHFDFSYQVPKDSIFEYLEIRDIKGARIRLLRDKSERDPTPGRIIHQLSDGSIYKEGYVYRHSGRFFFDKSPGKSSADNAAPLRQFLYKVASGSYDPDEPLQVGQNECDARFVSGTQELIKGIYRLCEAG